jgi:5-methylcytosine-specific restriction protein B
MNKEIKVDKESILKAIIKIDNNPELLKGRGSYMYDLIYNDKKYPPILVLSIANMENGGEELKLEDFGNNVEIPFEILRNYSYKIINKNENQKNNKEEFKSWVLNNLTDNSGAGPSYISSIEWLSERYFENGKISKKSIFEIEDIDLITKIHLEVKKIQRDKNSFIYNKNAPSYGERYFYSASISKYKEFLLFKNGGTIVKTSEKEQIIESINFNIDSFNENILESGLVFSEKLLTRFIASLLTKPFVLLTGLSGSGKTKIAQSFVQWICEDESQYKIIPVGADWTNREPLLGYPNGLNHKEYILPDSGALSLVIEASKIENNEKPYFLILDEMNLSHVERYFADFLSVMESEGKISLYSGTARKDLKENDVPDNIHWPKNLFIIGTVNIDETTYMFSPKVLDRANTIEFRLDESNIKNFFDLPSKIDLSVLKSKGASMAKNFLEIAADNTIDNGVDYSNTLVQFFNELKKVGAEYGYRTAVEMLLLIKKLNTISGISKNECIDIAIMQKLLPKLHGSRSKVSKVLDALILLCLKDGQTFSIAKSDEVLDENIKYPIAFEKLVRMYKNALDNGFTSYAEA